MPLIFFFGFIFLCVFNASSQNNNSDIIIKNIIINGNKITNENIILREIPFTVLDTLDSISLNSRILQAKQNLLNTSLFNFADISTINIDSNFIEVQINLIERHYIWPLPFFELADRNFNTWLKKWDFSRIYYGLYVVMDNFRGRKEVLKILAKGGLDKSFGFSYQTPNINKSKTLGLGFAASYTTTDDIAYDLYNDKLRFLNIPGDNVKTNVNVASQLSYRPDFNTYHNISLSYDMLSFADTVLILNPDYSPMNKQQYFTFIYSYRLDYRDFRPYPLNGFFIEGRLEKKGFGLFKNEDINMIYLEGSFKKYSQLANNLYLAAGVSGKITLGDKILFNHRNILGFGNTFVRGFEYYTINGKNMILTKTNLKYQILPQKVINLPFIKAKKFKTVPLSFYLNLYSDAAYAYNNKTNPVNKLNNTFLYGQGIGIDFVTYYDKIFRLEYSINSLNEKGVFMHFISSL